MDSLKRIIYLFMISVVFAIIALGIDMVEHESKREGFSINIPTALILDREKAHYAKTVESKLTVWHHLIQDLREKAKTVTHDERHTKLLESANALDLKSKELKQHLKKLKLTPKGEWHRLQGTIETGFAEMRTQYDRVLAE